MELYYDRGKARRNALIMVGAFVVGLGLLIWFLTIDTLGAVPEGALQGGAAGLMIAGAMQAWTFWNMSQRTDPIVTIGRDGIQFHLKDFPLLPWDRIRAAGVVRLFSGRQLTVLVEEPAPRLGALAAWRQAVTRRQQDGAMRYAIPLSRLTAGQREIDEAIVTCRPVPEDKAAARPPVS